MTTMIEPAATPRWRGITTWVLLVLFCVLAPLGLVTGWARVTVLNTDRYVHTVEPLSRNTAIQKAVSNAVSTVVLDRYTTATTAPRDGPVIAQAISDVVASSLFSTLWSSANRAAHATLVATLNNRGPDGNKGEVVLDLGPTITAVTDKLRSLGVSQAIVSAIPPGSTELVLFSSPDVESARRYTHLLDWLGVILPILALASLAGALLLGADRRRTVFRSGLGLSIAMAVLFVVLILVRRRYLDLLGPTLPYDAATAFFDILVRRLKALTIVLFGIGVVMAVIAAILKRRPAQPGESASLSV